MYSCPALRVPRASSKTWMTILLLSSFAADAGAGLLLLVLGLPPPPPPPSQWTAFAGDEPLPSADSPPTLELDAAAAADDDAMGNLPWVTLACAAAAAAAVEAAVVAAVAAAAVEAVEAVVPPPPSLLPLMFVVLATLLLLSPRGEPEAGDEPPLALPAVRDDEGCAVEGRTRWLDGASVTPLPGVSASFARPSARPAPAAPPPPRAG